MKTITIMLILLVISYSNSVYSCESITTPQIISQNTTWNTPQHLSTDVLILSGISLTITSDVFMYEKGRIDVEPGAKIIIDGGLITNDQCANSWGGIFVHGNRSMEQLPANQGMITMNDATLRNANTAITTSAYDCGFVWENVGGIIQAENSYFINNKRDVQFVAFEYSKNGLLQDYNAQFIQCNFIKNDNFLFSSDLPNITMFGVFGVKFKGCDFIYSTNLNFANLSCAIEAHNSTFIVTKKDNQKTGFNGYERTILALNTHRIDKSISIRHSEFYTNEGNAAMFRSCSNFYFGFNEVRADAHGTFNEDNLLSYLTPLIVDGCSNFDIEKNNFYSDFNAMNPGNKIDLLYNISGTNEIKHNSIILSAVHHAAINAFGTNRSSDGLEGVFITCNFFDENREDIRVYSYPDYYDTHNTPNERGIAPNQGVYRPNNPNTEEQLANNIFTNNRTHPYYTNDPNTYINYFAFAANNSYMNTITYTFPDGARTEPVLYSGGSIQQAVNLNKINSLNFSQSVFCPSPEPPPGVRGVDEIFIDLDYSHSQYMTAETEFSNVVDLGNTDSLIQVINNIQPTDYLNLRNELLDISPFFSPEACSKLIDKGDYDQSYLISILTANPHNIRSAHIKESLSEFGFSQSAWDSILEYEHELTSYDEKFSNLSDHHKKRGEFIKEATRKLTAQPDQSQEFLTKLETYEEPYLHYALVEHEITRNNYDRALNLLEEVKSFNLEGSEIIESIEMEKYYEIVIELRNEKIGMCDISTNQINRLWDIYESEARMASGKALSLLMLNDDNIDYIPPAYPSDVSGKKSNETHSKLSSDNQKLRFSYFPNPAKDYLLLRWTDEVASHKKVNKSINVRLLSPFMTPITSNNVLVKDKIYSFNINDIKSGIYILLIENEKGERLWHSKLLIQH